ncbi:hypothetical protein [Streptomyces xanthophaeus]|uniref:hypothetical protein n=1 Tax=Streptomyces xanthophaeus TaxID=67385 RepID=UPI00371B1E86
MRAALLAQARTIRVLALFGLFAWMFGIDPPGWQRALLVALAVAAVAASAALDEHRIRPACIPNPRYDTAA